MQWEDLTKELDAITNDLSVFYDIRLAVTEGEVDGKLTRPDHWPQHIEVKETVWRDYYTGERLEEYARPWYPGHDANFGEDYNCLALTTNQPWSTSWFEWQDYSYNMRCPCQYQQKPLLRLRGLCKILVTSFILDKQYTPVQLPGDPTNMLLVGKMHTRIEYDETTSKWTMTDARSSLTAISKASKKSYVLGKHTWTIFDDKSSCNPSQDEEYALQDGKWTLDSSNIGRPYTIQLKLTGCSDGEFACYNGDCVRMEERCDQVVQCTKGYTRQ